MGEIMSQQAVALGVAAVVIDGAVRDSEAIRELGFPMFAAGLNPNGPTKSVAGRLNHPISIGGVTVRPGDLVVGTGFRAPSLFELNDPNYGNPDLDPESSLGWELGHATTLLPGLSLGNTFFHTGFEDQISFDPTTFVSINLDGDSQVQGLESSLTWEPADGSHRLAANHTYVDAEDDDGATPYFKPRNTVGLAATWYWLDRAVWATLTLDWVDRYRVVGAEMEARTLAGVAAGWRIDERFTVYGRVRNLFDTTYAPNAGYSGEPLNAVLGASAEF